MPSDVDLENYDKLCEEEQKQAVEDINSIKKIIVEAISRLREEGLSYAKIGERISLHAGQVHMIEKGKWYPKTRRVENRIFEKLTRKPINLEDVEEKNNGGREDGGRTKNN